MPGPTDNKNHIYRIAVLGLCSALSLGIYAFESLLPPLFFIPGIKPGLSNIITLYCLKHFGKKDAGAVLLVRIIIAGILFGNPVSTIYSLAGGFAALLIEILADTVLKGKYLHRTGAFGGLFHNAGQLICAFFIMGSAAVFSYIPYLVLAGIITGMFTGLTTSFLLKVKIPDKP